MSKQIKLSQQGKNRGKYVALVDDEDFEELNKYRWSAMPVGRTVYAVRNINGKMITMHAYLCGRDGFEVDHIDGDGLNNSRSNLRIATREQNARNRKIIAGRKYKGVQPIRGQKSKKKYNKVNRKNFEAGITVGGKNISLGSFHTDVEAAIAYNEAALKYHGEFARLNVIPE